MNDYCFGVRQGKLSAQEEALRQAIADEEGWTFVYAQLPKAFAAGL